jgi:FkbM family methyltransferase
MKEANVNGFLKGREILYTWWSGQKDVFKCHYYALKTLYDHIDTKYVFHCEDDQIFKKTDFDYFELSYKILEHNDKIGVVLLRDICKDFWLKKTWIMKKRYYEILTDEVLSFYGHDFIVFNPNESFSLQPWLRNTQIMKQVMFWYEDHVDEWLVSKRLSDLWYTSIVIKKGIYNHINPIFNSTKNIKSLWFFRYIYTTLKGTITYRWWLFLYWCKNLIKKVYIYTFSYLAQPWLQRFWHAIYLVGLSGMWYGYGVNALSHAKKFIYKKLWYGNGKTFILFDVGANIWQTIEELLEMKLTDIFIYSFEPQKSAYQSLKRKFETNKDISLHNIGFWNENGVIDLYKDIEGDTGASIYSNGVNHFKEEIQIQTIDDFIEKKGIIYISYLKLDIEGAEYSALQGAKNAIMSWKIEAIEFEFLRQNIKSKVFLKDFRDLLSTQYDFYRILPYHIYKLPSYSHLLEVYCLSNFLCIKKWLL